MKIVNWITLLSCLQVLVACNGQSVSKVNGVSFVASRDSISIKHIEPVMTVNANYVAIMPFGFIRDLKHPEILYNTEKQWFGESVKGANQYIETFKKQNIKVMMKPQIWIWHGEYTGHLKMENDADWKLLEDSYANFILDFAKVAQDSDADILCIGTELEQFIINRPEFWNTLILNIKKVYKGKLTYAANWDEFKSTPFWSQLDYIGVDAYFPVSDTKTPTVEECEAGWQTHKVVIKSIADQYDKPVLFTEFGYRSVDYTGKEPWKSDRSMKGVNFEGQNNTTTALFNTFWNEEWFAGGFVWKWFVNHNDVGGAGNTMFTPQNKPVEGIIKKYFSKK